MDIPRATASLELISMAQQSQYIDTHPENEVKTLVSLLEAVASQVTEPAFELTRKALLTVNLPMTY